MKFVEPFWAGAWVWISQRRLAFTDHRCAGRERDKEERREGEGPSEH